MPIVDHATRLITCKLVYCGPGYSGKTTNLSYLHASLPADEVGSFTSVSTRRDRTLCFDYTPVELRAVGAYHVRFQLYTVPGISHNRAVRELVLQSADGIVFVADSRRDRLEENLESLQDLHRTLADQSVSARSLPFVFQYNKQDLPAEEILSAEQLSVFLNFRSAPEFAASASDGTGVLDTLRALGIDVLRRMGVRDVLPRELSAVSA